MPDIFELALEKKNSQIFERALEKKNERTIFERMDKAIPKMVRHYIKSHQIKPTPSISIPEILAIVKSELEKIPVPEKVIEKQIKVVEKKDSSASDALVASLKEEIDELRKKLGDVPKNWPNMRMGKIIPNLSNQQGKFLSNTGNKLVWADAGSITGSPDVYTLSNVTTDRSFDAEDTTLDELANVLGSLIQTLQSIGVVQ